MSIATRRQKPASQLEFKSAVLTLTSLALTSVDLGNLQRALDAQALEAPGLFDNDPLLIDLSAVQAVAEPLNLPALLALLRRHRLLPVAVRGGNAEQIAAALAAGLAVAPEESRAAPPPAASARPLERTDQIAAELTALAQPDALAPPRSDAAVVTAPSSPPPMVIDRPLRSGQQVYARGTDLIVLAIVNDGAEVIADGSIHVYAPLRGRAVAGAKGNAQARIFSTCMEAQLVSIAGTYRTTEVPFAADVRGKPAQVRMDGDRLVVEPIKP
jgi:septum site-determining protein MinC